jgi:3-isopropylmalate/(R)-2-methylmalate dehydratase small subunit
MALKNTVGRVSWIFNEDNFDVDQIVGVKNIKITDINELAAVAMKSFDPDFAKTVQKGDVVVGGENFGYGHPHYPPLKALRHLGIQAVIAESFAPGFYRGEISMGFTLVSCPGIRKITSRWDTIHVDWQNLTLTNQTTQQTLPINPISTMDEMMLERGGFIPYLKARLQMQKENQKDS